MKNSIQFFLLICFLFTIPYNLSAICDPGETSPQCDSVFLHFFYDVHDGDDWINTWDFDQPMSTWHGVTVDDEGYVTKIDLSNNNLGRGVRTFNYGESLTRLVDLNLSNNEIVYIMFSEENLHSLKKVDLSNNAMVSLFSSTNLYQIPSLEYLDLSRNNLDIEISKVYVKFWESLEYLDLSINSIHSNIPSELSEVKNLKTLKLDNNELLGTIPESFVELNQLEHLDLSGNELDGEIPVYFSGFTQLSGLYLANNLFTGCLDESLENFCSLPFNEEPDAIITHRNKTVGIFTEPGFNMLGNQLLPWEGDIRPFCIGESQIGAPCTNYNVDTEEDFINDECGCFSDHCGDRGRAAMFEIWNALDGPNWNFNFSYNSWGTDAPISEWFGVETNDEGCVVSISLTHYGMEGTLPDNFDAFLELESLTIRAENISGPIPESLKYCTNLKSLDLFMNLENEELPDIFENMTSLEEIIIDEVGLVGTLPPSLKNCVSLVHLDLSDNQLGSQLPEYFDQLQQLKLLNLASNNFLGQVPMSLMYVENLESINLSNNKILAWFLPEDNNLSSIKLINLDYNNISTAIPNTINTIPTLRTLLMGFNKVIGFIPQELCECDLKVLGLSGNDFRGEIPPCMGDVDFVTLYLSSNTFEGELPSTSGEKLWPNIHNLYLDNNQFSGEIPDNLGIENLVNLHLEHNQFEGDISSFEISSKMWEVDLSNNNFSGLLPELNLSNNKGKNFISFAHNQFESPIPASWEALRVRHVINVSHNNFTGQVPDFIGNILYFIDQWNIFYTDINLSNNDFEGCVESGEIKDRIDLSNNPKLAWQGEIPQSTSNQIGAPCNDGDPSTSNDEINADCSCGGAIFDTCEDSDREALQSLYDTNGGDDWVNNENWGNTGPLDSWYGIETNAQGCVVSISLPDNNLSGVLSPALSSLTELRTLSLPGNNLMGSLPLQILSLENLAVLNLRDNLFENCIPEEYTLLCDIDLDLSENDLLPWEGDVSFFCNLEDQIGAPCNDGNPNTLDDVIGSQCGCGQGFFTACAEENRFALMKLFEQTNGPSWINKSNWGTDAPLSSWHGVRTNGQGCVINLDLSFNNLNGILPEEIGQLGQVEFLNLSFNNLRGEIPNLQGLEEAIGIELSFNEFTGGLPLLSHSVVNITIRGTKISGALPEQWGDLNRLHIVHLTNNFLSGNIPESWFGMVELTELTLSMNRLSGRLPVVLTELPNLRELELDHNLFYGSIPDEYGNFHSISTIDVENNHLTGTLPLSLLNLNNVEFVYFRLQNNNLEGCIPDEFVEVICESNFRRIFLKGNDRMPWAGDFERYCDGDSQVGAECDDGNGSTFNDKIDSNCKCQGGGIQNPDAPSFPNANLTTIYPNPASSVIHIPNDEKRKISRLLGVRGEVLKTTSGNQLNVQDIPNGMYFVEYEVNKLKKVQKVVIQH